MFTSHYTDCYHKNPVIKAAPLFPEGAAPILIAYSLTPIELRATFFA